MQSRVGAAADKFERASVAFYNTSHGGVRPQGSTDDAQYYDANACHYLELECDNISATKFAGCHRIKLFLGKKSPGIIRDLHLRAQYAERKIYFVRTWGLDSLVIV